MGRPCRHPVLVLGAFKLFSRASEPLTFFTSVYRSSVYPHRRVVLMLWPSSLCSVWAILFNVKRHFLAVEHLSWAAASSHYISSLEKHHFSFSTLGVFVCFCFDSVNPIAKAYLQFLVHLTAPCAGLTDVSHPWAWLPGPCMCWAVFYHQVISAALPLRVSTLVIGRGRMVVVVVLLLLLSWRSFVYSEYSSLITHIIYKYFLPCGLPFHSFDSSFWCTRFNFDVT